VVSRECHISARRSEVVMAGADCEVSYTGSIPPAVVIAILPVTARRGTIAVTCVSEFTVRPHSLHRS